MLDLSNVRVVIDTCVLLDIYSCHDLGRAYDKHGTDFPDTPALTYRRARARESLLLAVYLHRARAVTWNLADESVRKLLEAVPPNESDTFELHYTTVMVNYVRDQVIPCWTALQDTQPETVHGTEADVFAVNRAKELGVPMITNEGYTASGVQETKMRKRAAAAGVPVFTPCEYWTRRIDPDDQARWFLGKYRQRAERYIATHPNPALIRESMLWVGGYFEHVLFGVTASAHRAKVAR